MSNTYKYVHALWLKPMDKFNLQNDNCDTTQRKISKILRLISILPRIPIATKLLFIEKWRGS